jgi:menaquinone-dependent protoporphyrinogen IX oxidase
MGNSPGLTFSAGVVQKVLPKHNNRTRQKPCGLFATQPGYRKHRLSKQKKPGIARPFY